MKCGVSDQRDKERFVVKSFFFLVMWSEVWQKKPHNDYTNSDKEPKTPLIEPIVHKFYTENNDTQCWDHDRDNGLIQYLNAALKKRYWRDTLKAKQSLYSAMSFLTRVDLPLPLGPDITTGRNVIVLAAMLRRTHFCCCCRDKHAAAAAAAAPKR